MLFNQRHTLPKVWVSITRLKAWCLLIFLKKN